MCGLTDDYDIEYTTAEPKTEASAANIASVDFFSTNSTVFPGIVKVPIVVDPPTESITDINLAVPPLLQRRTTVALPNGEAPAAFVPHAA